MDPWTLNVLSQLAFMGFIKAGVLNGAVLKLYQNDLVPTKGTVIADLTEATFTGYASITLTTWNGPYINASGNCVVLAGQKQFDTASPYTVGNNVYGYWVESSTGDLLLIGRFADAPIPMAAAGNALLANPNYEIGSAGPF